MTDRRSAGWRVERSTGSAASLLAPWPPAESQGDAIVRAGRVGGRPTLVLGSTQDRTSVNELQAARAGVDIVRRSTGGGAVLVAPDAQVWLDLWLPRRHHLWDDDVVAAAAWVGDTWVDALRTLGAAPLRVHRGPMIRTPWSDRLCFAGLGPGEVSVVEDRDGAATSESTGPKVMGLAQRRTRAGARFHTSAPLRWDPEPILDLFTTERAAPDDGEHDAPRTAEPSTTLKSVALGLRAVVAGASQNESAGALITAVEEGVITALP